MQYSEISKKAWETLDRRKNRLYRKQDGKEKNLGILREVFTAAT